MAKKVLITGVTGFIGNNLAERLIEKGYSVYGVIKYVVARDLKKIDRISKNLTPVTCDITDKHAVKNMLNTVIPDYVIHLAAMSPVRLSFQHPFEFQQANYLGTLNIAHSMMDLPDAESRRLVVASTAEVYGIRPENKPYKEEMALRPSSPYSVSKAAMDMYIRMMMNSFGLNATIMRCVNTYGRKYDKGFFIEYVINEMLKGKKIYIGAPDSIRDYMYVDDHVNAYIMAMESKDAKGEAFNVSTGKGVTNGEAAKIIADIIGFDKNKLVLGSYPPGYPHRPLASDQPYLVLDSSKIRNLLGWRPTVTLEQGLEKTINHWSKITRR
jgi:dTDP-glucose 4,6-dehydratase